MDILWQRDRGIGTRGKAEYYSVSVCYLRTIFPGVVGQTVYFAKKSLVEDPFDSAGNYNDPENSADFDYHNSGNYSYLLSSLGCNLYYYMAHLHNFRCGYASLSRLINQRIHHYD